MKPCTSPWHDTPPDSAPVAHSQPDISARTDEAENAAGGGDTPETDADLWITKYYIAANFSRNLERQRDEAQERIRDLLHTIDRLDCSFREGADTRHCRLDNPCVRCQRDEARRELADAKVGSENLRSGVLLNKMQTTIENVAASFAVEQLRTELTDATAKIAELEREVTAQTWAAESAAAQIVTDEEMDERIACARAETAEECAVAITPFVISAAGFPDTAKLIVDEKIRAIASAPSNYVCVDIRMLRFLNGEEQHPKTGLWLGEESQDGGYRRYWWRRYIEEMLSAARKQP